MSADPPGGEPGTPITISYTVSNTGDLTVFSIVITDKKLGMIGQISSLTPGQHELRTKGDTIESPGKYEGAAIGKDELGREVPSASASLQVAIVLAKKFAYSSPPGC